MSCEEIESICREAWNEKNECLLINKLEEKFRTKYQIFNESTNWYKTFIPQTDPF